MTEMSVTATSWSRPGRAHFLRSHVPNFQDILKAEKPVSTDADELQEVRNTFIAQWGAMGPLWGITRSMARLHACLLAADEPQSTDALMETLGISRGNANTHLRQLASWGLVRPVHVPGDRKEYFEAEKKVWKIFCIIARERKRREVDPALAVLRDCAVRTKGIRSKEGKSFHAVVSALSDFVATASGILDRAAARQESAVMPALMKLFR
jgi:DNA-binding transcriptional regulator GbsR (MarR family)